MLAQSRSIQALGLGLCVVWLSAEGSEARLFWRLKRGLSLPHRSKDYFVMLIRGPGTRGPGNRKRWRPLPTDSYAGYRLFH